MKTIIFNDQSLIEKKARHGIYAADSAFLISDNDFQYNMINLKKVPNDEIYEILKGCEQVERKCWNAQEDFFVYASKCDFLYYAEKNGEIKGFFLLSLINVEDSCIVSMDEIMVDPQCQSQKIALKLAMTAFRDITKSLVKISDFSRIITMSITANPRMMNSYCEGSILTNWLDTSFNPSEPLKKVYETYLEEMGYDSVDKNTPFFIKSLFPGSNKNISIDENDTDKKIVKFSDEFKKFIPNGFDPVKRGDSLCFMVSLKPFMFRFLNLIFMQRLFGFSFWSSERIRPSLL